MQKEDIRIEKVIVHIMDSTVGLPVLSEREIEFGSEFAEFLREHIYRVWEGDDSKTCAFHREESEIYRMLDEYSAPGFVDMSKEIANLLYGIMNSNIDIPAADLVVVRFHADDTGYLALLKMNFTASYTHRTLPEGDGNYNEIIRYRSVLPSKSQRLSEAAIIDLTSREVRLIEKKYEVNGEKLNYFSMLFLKCDSRLSDKSKLSIVTKAVESVQKANFDEYTRFEEHMKAKSIMQETLNDTGGFVVDDLADRIFENEPAMREQFQEKMEKYDLVKEEVLPKMDATVKKYQNQHLFTDTGIEIKIPMELYKDARKVEFVTNPDGTVSVILKNIGHIEAKF